MSGNSYEINCPNCGCTVGAYSDHKPFDLTSIGPCLNCGFQTITEVKYLNLEELNEAREEHDTHEDDEEDKLGQLTELPEQEEM